MPKAPCAHSEAFPLIGGLPREPKAPGTYSEAFPLIGPAAEKGKPPTGSEAFPLIGPTKANSETFPLGRVHWADGPMDCGPAVAEGPG